MRIAITRPRADGERTAATLRARGHEVLLAPLTTIENLAADLGDGPFAAMLITSANGIAFAHAQFERLAGVPVLTVGDASAAAARQAGFKDVTSANGDMHDLVRIAAGRCTGATAPLLYLAGENRAGDLAAELKPHGLEVRTAVVYRAVPLPFPPELAQAIRRRALDAVMHFSRRAAQLYVDGADEAGALGPALAMSLTHFCLSDQIAEVLVDAGSQNALAAASPDEASLLALAG